MELFKPTNVLIYLKLMYIGLLISYNYTYYTDNYDKLYQLLVIYESIVHTKALVRLLSKFKE